MHCVIVILLLLILCARVLASTRPIRYVRPNGTSPLTCPSQPCLTLNQYAKQPFSTGDTLAFLVGNHSLDHRISLDNISDVTFKGERNGPAIINVNCCNGYAIQCKNVTNLTIQGLTFALHANTSERDLSAFGIFSSVKVSMDNLTFKGSTYSNSKAMYSQDSQIEVANCLLQGMSGNYGGAISISRAILNLTDTTFTANKARSGGAVYAINSNMTIMGSKHSNSRTTCFSAVVSTSHSSNTFEMPPCGTIFYGNVARERGGAMYLYHTKAVFGGTVIFRENTAKSGGGLHVSSSQLIVLNSAETAMLGGIDTPSEEPIPTHNMNFIGNTAETYGGGIWISRLNNATVSGYFTNNRAGSRGGAIAALSVNNLTFNDITVQNNSNASICVSFSTVTFSGNTTVKNNNGKLGGGICARRSSLFFTGSADIQNNSASKGGAIYMTYGTLSLSANLTFRLNQAEANGGALYAVGTDINMNAENTVGVQFVHNSAQNGGAMYFTNEVSLLLSHNVNFFTSCNYASEYGGAIYNQDKTALRQCARDSFIDTSELPLCFLSLSSRILYSYFYNDSAGKDGSFLYGGLLDKCQPVLFLKSPIFRASNTIYNWLKKSIHTPQEKKMTKTITSAPYKLCFCGNEARYNCTQSYQIVTQRGQEFNISVIALAQWDTVTPTAVLSKTSSTARLGLGQNSHHIQGMCSNLSYNLFSTASFEELILYSDGPCQDTGLSRAVVNVTLLPCPHGFILSGEQCICEERLRAANCIIDKNISITRNSSFWVSAAFHDDGKYQGLILSKTCPEGFCEREAVISLDNPDLQCSTNRSGILCGACATNYSLMLGSSRCEECSNAYLALLLPFAAAGVALVVFLSISRLTVATGMINSIILYANIVQADTSMKAINVLTVFIAWINLDFGFEVCFYNGMTAYHHSWLQLVFPAYIWVIVCLIVVFSKYSTLLSKLTGHNPIAVLATLLLMSYTKVLKIAIDVFSNAVLDYPSNHRVRVWLKDANVPYLQSGHLTLAVMTAFVILFAILPYTLLILLGYKLYRFSGKKVFCWLNRLKPLLDSYYAPYNKNARYWPGLLLIVRCFLYVTFSFRSRMLSSLILIFTFAFLIILLCWMFARIYERRLTTVIELSVFTNILVTSFFSLAGFNSSVIMHILIGIVFVTTLGIMVYHFHVRFTGKLQIWSKIKSRVCGCHKMFGNRNTNERNEVPSESRLPKKVSTTFVELRESLLDS